MKTARLGSPAVLVTALVLVAGLLANVAPASASCGSINNLGYTLTQHQCAVITWNAVAGADEYEYIWRPGGYINFTLHLDTPNTILSLGASNGGSFRVRAICGSEEGPWASLTIPNPGFELE